MVKGRISLATKDETRAERPAGSVTDRNFRSASRRRGRLPLAVAAYAMLAALPAAAEEFTAAQKSEIESIVKSFLLRQPEILREAAGELDAREKIAEAKARDKVVSDASGELYSGASQAVVGNPSGKITLVEFFDYNCGYCKRALGDLERLMKENPDLRVLLRDLPILSESSIDAARVANAARLQLTGEKFWAFHRKLMATRGMVGKAEALAVAKEVGADMTKLEKDLETPAVETGIEESERLAKALHVNGTPAYVVGQDVVIGAVGYPELNTKLLNTRKCGKALC